MNYDITTTLENTDFDVPFHEWEIRNLAIDKAILFHSKQTATSDAELVCTAKTIFKFLTKNITWEFSA